MCQTGDGNPTATLRLLGTSSLMQMPIVIDVDVARGTLGHMRRLRALATGVGAEKSGISCVELEQDWYSVE